MYGGYAARSRDKLSSLPFSHSIPCSKQNLIYTFLFAHLLIGATHVSSFPAHSDGSFLSHSFFSPNLSFLLLFVGFQLG